LDAAAYARFLEAVGHRVVRAGSQHWYEVSSRFYMSAPPNFVISPSDDELRAVFAQTRCVGVRYAAPLDGPGRLSYQIACDDAGYGLETLSSNNRSKVRRGLKRCRVEPTPMAVIAEHGKRAHEDTVGRQGRDGVLGGERWGRFFDVAGRTEGFEGWAAWIDDQLAAFLITVSFPDSVEFLLARSRSDLLGAYPNNALVFTVTEEMLARRRVGLITYGLESLEPVGPLDQFKFGMGFSRRPLRQRIVFHPLLRAPLGVPAIRSALLRFADSRGDSGVFWRKAAGLLRFADETTPTGEVASPP
jgi:hypothetical protein